MVKNIRTAVLGAVFMLLAGACVAQPAGTLTTNQTNTLTTGNYNRNVVLLGFHLSL